MTTFLLNADQPEISEHPQNQIVLEGLNVSFSCNASGNPTPTFSWTVKRTDGGEYKCLGSNSVKTVNSTAAFLIVQCKEAFTIFQTFTSVHL